MNNKLVGLGCMVPMAVLLIVMACDKTMWWYVAGTAVFGYAAHVGLKVFKGATFKESLLGDLTNVQNKLD